MYTQCPQCRTIFEINEDALQASLGIVRCGHCSERFDALRTLSESLPAGPEAALPEHDPEALAPTLTSAIAPGGMQAAAQPARGSASEAVPSNDDTLATAQPDEAWFDAFSGDRARALIADAAGIPPETIQGDPAWQLPDLPMQARFAELDAIPTPGVESLTEPSKANPPTPAAAVAAESEPFTEAWGLDIPVEPVAPEEHATSDVPTANAGAAECADDTDATVPLTATETESDIDSWLPEDPLRAEDLLSPGTGATEEENPASMAPQDEPPDDDAEHATVAPHVYVPPRRRRIRRSDWLWAIGCALLALALTAQIAWNRRVMLVRDPATQAQALRLCARFDCRLPPIRDTTKLELLSRDVRPDPDASGALAITATFRNNAPYRQPWPIVVVELTDLDNNVVAMRRFRPVEYMPDAARRTAGIAAGTTAAVAFEVADPGKRAVSFHFGFD